MSGIVEEIGTVAESAESIARKPDLIDAPDAVRLKVSKGDISFRNTYGILPGNEKGRGTHCLC